MRPLYVKLLQSSITSTRTVRPHCSDESHVISNLETRKSQRGLKEPESIVQILCVTIY